MYKEYNLTQHTLPMETSVLIPTNDILTHEGFKKRTHPSF